MTPRFLVTGPTGQVGRELISRLSAHGQVIACGRDQLDLADPHALSRIGQIIRDVAPASIFNPAAWTAVDAAEANADAAFTVNAKAAEALARAARLQGALMVQWSTDFVFDGVAVLDEHGAPRAWTEDDPTAPVSIYGASKLAGEQAVIHSGARALVLRTAWVWSRGGKCFPEAIMARARTGATLRVVADQYGCPTHAGSLAQMAIDAALQSINEPGREGLYHLTAAGHTTWHGLALAVCRAAGLDNSIAPIETADWPTPARRPPWSVLDCSRFERAFGLRMADWTEDVLTHYGAPAEESRA